MPDLSKTLEELEGDVWPDPTYDSYLVTTVHTLRKKPVREFEVEDLRIMIGQGVGLKYLLPEVFKVLMDNPLAGGDFYEGDLLEALTRNVPEELLEQISKEDLNLVFESDFSVREQFDEKVFVQIRDAFEAIKNIK